jgi:hypothetical protein
VEGNLHLITFLPQQRRYLTHKVPPLLLKQKCTHITRFYHIELFFVYVKGRESALPSVIFLLQPRRCLTRKVPPLVKQNAAVLPDLDEIFTPEKDLEWGSSGN